MNLVISRMSRYMRVCMLLAIGPFIMSSCGASTPAASTPVPTLPPTSNNSTPSTQVIPTSAPSGAITNLDDVKKAVVQIETEGSFIPRTEQEGVYIGHGSGFIIDPSGIVITNNHVVTGAGRIKVHIGGEKQDPDGTPASVLGVSECSDIAVLQIQRSGPFAYLDWFPGEIKNLLPVIAVGFPAASNRGYDTTRGSISQIDADGQTAWASVTKVLEHDARINPGSSGGPLITDSAQVVGVNYAGTNESRLYFAIGRDEVRGLVSRLKEGKNDTYVGINGEAFRTDNFAGIWVSSVQPGSPADLAGVKAGDVITSFGSVPMAQKGTMSDYCDVLRSNPDRPIAIKVYRPGTQQTFEGALNTPNRELKAVAEPAPTSSGSIYSYQVLTHTTGALSVEVPVAWGNSGNDGIWKEDDKQVGISVSANVSRDSFQNWTGPGVWIGVSRVLARQLTLEKLLDKYSFNDSCTYGGRNDYNDGTYTGKYDLWSDCKDTKTKLFVIVFEPSDQAFIGMVQIQVVNEADVEARDRIVQTFQAKGDF